ncbi:MAG: glycosyltransferase family 1 protein [Acidobacteria bacterium]|nr:MAG: glycosyltransferase family 1 protein [Acidobacteriota bacterium]
MTRRRSPARPGPQTPPARRRVAHLIASNFFGGPERQILGHAARLGRYGWEAVIGSFREGRPAVEIVERARERGRPAFLVDTASPFSPDNARQLARFLSEMRVEVLATHGYKADIYGHLAAAKVGIPRIAFLRGLTGENLKVRLYERAYRWSLRRADRVVAVSEAMRRLALRIGVRAERICVVRNADVREDGFGAPIDVRRALGWEGDPRPVLIAAGRLSPEKGQDVLVRAVAHLRERGRPVLAAILGEGARRRRLERLIRRERLADSVRLAGFRHELPRWIAGADLLVNPSRSEGLPNVILEAFRVGTPVVATEVGGVPEAVVDGETGWTVPPDDPEALAGAIEQALRSPAEAQRRAERARERLSREFDPERQTRALAAIYDALAPRAAGHAAVARAAERLSGGG